MKEANETSVSLGKPMTTVEERLRRLKELKMCNRRRSVGERRSLKNIAGSGD